ncbi:metal-dependent transcriptional regulator [Putridiphycobacter roseus]|uniref:Transcriptional regulator MntR n=1 Tax=Putridiphycobacter roseus TaxID=2219161 RepID=A0A2W1NEW8_9FLAO|nr:metal-dependent transcriptional regulator [Putridiphycobacter roseus]PZE18005.1 metal-dependent transcriptional regulator [Putridiphycobacter roseus]
MSSPTKENYLKAAYFLHQKNKTISVTDLAKEMKISTPTANNMVKKMAAFGWVDYEKYKPITLTNEGIKLGALIVRKHRLSEMFLSKVMGFGWEEVHDIAEELEHLNSNKFFERMDEILGFPSSDPHGSPIPDKNGKVQERVFLSLLSIEPEQKVKLSALKNSSKDLLFFLNKKEIKLGTEMKVIQKEQFDNSIHLLFKDGKSTVLSQQAAACLLVELI